MTDRRSDFLEHLMAVIRSAGSLEFAPFLQKVISAASELTGSEVAAILEYDERGKSLRFLAVPPAYQDTDLDLPLAMDKSAAGWAIQAGQPLRIPNQAMPSSFLGSADLKLTARAHSLLAVPLILFGKPVGVLEALNKNKSDYTEEDVTILETLAAPAALAIGNNSLQSRMEASFEELSELDRLKSDFIAITSHELRTPLGVILGHATYLREVLDSEHREQVDVIIKNTARLKEIVESVASMDNHKTGRARLRHQAVPIGHIIAEVTASFAETAVERNITLQVPPVPADLLVEADHTKISIALGNLVNNAIAFTNDGGHIRIETECLAGYVKVSVIDDGVGIPRKDLPRVFDRFFQVESHLTRRHNGLGLGLSVAKVMIEMHGGRIWVESVEGKGSNFSFLLPMQSAGTQPAMF
jgi:signal transduction histidine kinase